MTDVFRTVLNMSVTGVIAVFGVLLLRLPLKRAPRWIRSALWLVVFFRLLVPFSFSAPVSLLGSIGAPEPANGVVEYLPTEYTSATTTAQPSLENAQNSVIRSEQFTQNTNSLAPTPQASADPLQIWLSIGTAVWLAGAVALLIHALYLYIRLNKRVSDAVFVEPGVFETDAIASPFVIGILRPRIILPVGMPGLERDLVLRHEHAHILRMDHVMKPIAFLALAVHWFNPLVWLAFRLFCEDMEASCDERAIRMLEREQIAVYGDTLLRLGTRRAAFAGGPLAFGEHCTKERIVNVLNYKKPAFWIVAGALIAAVAAAVVLLANPLVPPKQAVEPTVKELEFTNFHMDRSQGDTIPVPDRNPDPVSGKILVTAVGGDVNELVKFSLDISVLGDKEVLLERVDDFANQLGNGHLYIKTYLEKNAVGRYDKETANSSVDYVIFNDDQYSYDMSVYPYQIRVGKFYWHCAEQYVFMILHPESLHWQHYGYAQYLGSVLNPYDMHLAKLNRLGVTLPMGKYVIPYYHQGGTVYDLTNNDYRLLMDSVAYYCIKNGMNWGTAYESYPITEVYGFTEPAEQGDDMSVIMATSFCAYLADTYGFDQLTSYCSGQMTFKEAFHISFDRAYGRWQKAILKEFSN